MRYIYLNLIILMLSYNCIALSPRHHENSYGQFLKVGESERKEVPFEIFIKQMEHYIDIEEENIYKISDKEWYEIIEDQKLKEHSMAIQCDFDIRKSELEISIEEKKGDKQEEIYEIFSNIFPKTYIDSKGVWIIPIKNLNYNKEVFAKLINYSISSFLIKIIRYIIIHRKDLKDRFVIPQKVESQKKCEKVPLLRRDVFSCESVIIEENLNKKYKVLDNPQVVIFLKLLFKKSLTVLMMIVILSILFIDILGIITLVISIVLVLLMGVVPLIVIEYFLTDHYKKASFKIIDDWIKKSCVNSMKYFILDDPLRESGYFWIKVIKHTVFSLTIANLFLLFLWVSMVTKIQVNDLKFLLPIGGMIIINIGLFIGISIINRLKTIVDQVIKEESEKVFEKGLLYNVYKYCMNLSSDTSPLHKKRRYGLALQESIAQLGTGGVLTILVVLGFAILTQSVWGSLWYIPVIGIVLIGGKVIIAGIYTSVHNKSKNLVKLFVGVALIGLCVFVAMIVVFIVCLNKIFLIISLTSLLVMCSSLMMAGFILNRELALEKETSSPENDMNTSLENKWTQNGGSSLFVIPSSKVSMRVNLSLLTLIEQVFFAQAVILFLLLYLMNQGIVKWSSLIVLPIVTLVVSSLLYLFVHQVIQRKEKKNSKKEVPLELMNFYENLKYQDGQRTYLKGWGGPLFLLFKIIFLASFPVLLFGGVQYLAVVSCVPVCVLLIVIINYFLKKKVSSLQREWSSNKDVFCIGSVGIILVFFLWSLSILLGYFIHPMCFIIIYPIGIFMGIILFFVFMGVKLRKNKRQWGHIGLLLVMYFLVSSIGGGLLLYLGQGGEVIDIIFKGLCFLVIASLFLSLLIRLLYKSTQKKISYSELIQPIEKSSFGKKVNGGFNGALREEFYQGVIEEQKVTVFNSNDNMKDMIRKNIEGKGQVVGDVVTALFRENVLGRYDIYRSVNIKRLIKNPTEEVSEGFEKSCWIDIKSLNFSNKPEHLKFVSDHSWNQIHQLFIKMNKDMIHGIDLSRELREEIQSYYLGRIGEVLAPFYWGGVYFVRDNQSGEKIDLKLIKKSINESLEGKEYPVNMLQYQISPQIQEVQGNFEKIINILEKVAERNKEKSKEEQIHFVQFGELSLTGYSLGESASSHYLREKQQKMKEQIIEKAKDLKIGVSFGFIETEKGERGSSEVPYKQFIAQTYFIPLSHEYLEPTNQVIRKNLLYSEDEGVETRKYKSDLLEDDNGSIVILKVKNVDYAIKIVPVICQSGWNSKVNPHHVFAEQDPISIKMRKAFSRKEKGPVILNNVSASPYYLQKPRKKTMTLLRADPVFYKIGYIYNSTSSLQGNVIFCGASQVFDQDGNLQYVMKLAEEDQVEVNLSNMSVNKGGGEEYYSSNWKEKFLKEEDVAVETKKILYLQLRDYCRYNFGFIEDRSGQAQLQQYIEQISFSVLLNGDVFSSLFLEIISSPPSALGVDEKDDSPLNEKVRFDLIVSELSELPQMTRKLFRKKLKKFSYTVLDEMHISFDSKLGLHGKKVIVPNGFAMNDIGEIKEMSHAFYCFIDLTYEVVCKALKFEEKDKRRAYFFKFIEQIYKGYHRDYKKNSYKDLMVLTIEYMLTIGELTEFEKNILVQQFLEKKDTEVWSQKLMKVHQMLVATFLYIYSHQEILGAGNYPKIRHFVQFCGASQEWDRYQFSHQRFAQPIIIKQLDQERKDYFKKEEQKIEIEENKREEFVGWYSIERLSHESFLKSRKNSLSCQSSILISS